MISLAANFNCDPIAAPLQFWVDKLGWSDRVRCAPYNQIFQQLADPSGLMLSSDNRASVVLVRHEDWARFAGHRSGEPLAPAQFGLLRARTHELIEAIEGTAKRTSAPFILVSCPPSAASAASPGAADLFRTLDRELGQAFADRAQVTVLVGTDLVARYSCRAVCDDHADQIGHVPYTQDLFAVLATAIARALFALRAPPRKVIVLDCDHTLWGGVLGEDGVQGVTIDGPRRALQELVVSQQQRGVLVCLCSKNNEADVWELFDKRTDMALTRDHIVAWRINWQPKSQSIEELAAELNLGLDSFIFIDDDSLQCAEVRTRCPQVVTLQVPKSPDDIPQFFEHVWVLDRPRVTAEDRERTNMYRVERAREQVREAAGSLGEFLASLELRTEITAPAAGDVPRLAQLTQRTNQFNFTTIRRTEAEVQALISDPETVCLSVRVADRFGDYGLVGFAIARRDGDRLAVDTFLLSCRVLGRGVEHRVIARLGELARERGLAALQVRSIPTAKNIPARDFAEAALGAYKTDDHLYVLPVAAAAAVELRPDSTPVAAPRDEGGKKLAPSGAITSELVHEIAERRTAARLVEWMTVVTALGGDLRTETEVAVARIVAEQLGLTTVTRDANFYELGGDSLKALQTLARIRDVLGVQLAMDVLLEPTLSIEVLARCIDEAR